jgi:RNA polymerase primary sigma factor
MGQRGERQANVARRIITQTDLDGRLGRLAQEPDSFAKKAAALAARLDKTDTRLELRDPSSWRKPIDPETPPARVPLTQQFRAEVESILPLDRETEARLARRIEFARIRLHLALEKAGLTEAELEGNQCSGTEGFVGEWAQRCDLPPAVSRRWLELHSLRTEMVERNLYLVLINVERYSHTTASQLDLIQEGSAALFRAVDGFDWRRGLLFRTYAVHWLNQAFRSFLYNFTNTVRVPVYLQKAMKHINDAKNRIGDVNASVERIAEEAEIGENLVTSAMAAARSSRSIDVSFEDDEEGGRLKDLLQVPNDEGPYSTALEDVSLEQSMAQALERLSERERYVVQMRFGVGADREHTLAEVAEKLGVSLERVRQIQVRAINKLRSPALRKVVDPFLN